MYLCISVEAPSLGISSREQQPVSLSLFIIIVSPPLLRSVNGQSILTQQKSWSLLPPQPRNAIPESIASHSSLFPSLFPSLSRFPSPSGQSAEIVAVAKDDPRTEQEAVAEEIPNTKHTC